MYTYIPALKPPFLAFLLLGKNALITLISLLNASLSFCMKVNALPCHFCELSQVHSHQGLDKLNVTLPDIPNPQFMQIKKNI